MTVASPESPVAALLAPAASVTPRFRPAVVGWPGRQQLVHVPCPDWCIVDHVELHERAIEDISHWSKLFGAQVASMAAPAVAHIELFARVNSDPASDDPRMRAAHVLVGDGSADDAYQTPDMADEAADELIAFAVRLKGAARTAREANRAAGLA
jgi:hypothetical protein